MQLTNNLTFNLLSNYCVVFMSAYLMMRYLDAIVGGGVGKNGSTVAVSVMQLGHVLAHVGVACMGMGTDG